MKNRQSITTMAISAVAVLTIVAAGMGTTCSAQTGEAVEIQAAIPGVHDDRVVVGMNAAFSGPSAGLGIELWRGVRAAFDEANAKGGVAGRKIELVLSDDGYDAERAEGAYRSLAESGEVFNTGWSVGTPTMVRTLPAILEHFHEESLFHFGSFTGAQPQRNPPYAKAVYNIRSSYHRETAAMVAAFVRVGMKRIGVFRQDDAYGLDGLEGVRMALRQHGLKVTGEVRYERGRGYEKSAKEAVESLRGKGVDAVIMIGSYQACAAFIRDARLSGWEVPIHNVSFVGPRQMLDLLIQEENRTGKPIIRKIVNTLVVPHYADLEVPLVRAYRSAINAADPGVPAITEGSGFTSSGRYSFVSLEGYLTARVYLEILERVGRDLTRERFIEVATGTGSIEVGLDEPLDFDPDSHQALNRVWFVFADSETWRPTHDVRLALQ